MGFWNSKTSIEDTYSYSSRPTFVVEPWTVYTGRVRSSTSSSSQLVSVFVFDKKDFENSLVKSGVLQSKSLARDRQFINDAYDTLRCQVNNLAKLKHPAILNVLEPLKEHTKCFKFVTEHVTGSLATVYEGKETDDELINNEVNDVLTQRGILQIAQALDFLHNKTNSVLLDIQPQSVLVTDNFDWKIFGLGHLIKLPASTNSADFMMPQFDPKAPPFMLPDFKYTAPEVLLDDVVSPKSDYYSLGQLVYFLYYGKSIMNCTKTVGNYTGEINRFQNKIGHMTWDTFFSRLPPTLRREMPRLMHRDLFSRYDNITEFIDSPFFQDPLVKTMLFVNDLAAKTEEEEVIFFQGLPDLLQQFPIQLLQKKFLPAFLHLLDRSCTTPKVNAQLVSSCLNNIILIGESLSQLSFNEKITPLILSKDNFEVLLRNATSCLIEHLEILSEKLKQEAFVEKLLKPLHLYVLKLSGENGVPLQEELLAKLKFTLELLDFPSVKHFLFPLISALFVKTTSLIIKIACINTFQEMVALKSVDKYIVMDELLPLLKSMKTRDNRVLMKLVGFFRILPEFLQDDLTMVQHILPLMWMYSMSATLLPEQYSQFIEVLNQISEKIQQNHLVALKNSSTNDLAKTNFETVIDKAAPQASSLSNGSINDGIPVLQPRKAGPKKHVTIQETPSHNYSQAYDSPVQMHATKKTTEPVTGVPKASSQSNKTIKPLLLTKGLVAENKHSRSQTRNTYSNSQDEFNDFMSSEQAPVALAEGLKSVNVKTSMNAASNPVQSLPPGYSISLLQPNKRTA